MVNSLPTLICSCASLNADASTRFNTNASPRPIKSESNGNNCEIRKISNGNNCEIRKILISSFIYLVEIIVKLGKKLFFDHFCFGGLQS